VARQALTEEESVGNDRVRIIRLRHYGPIEEELPDVGDVLQTVARGVRHLIVSSRPTRGHDPAVVPRRITVTTRRLDDDEALPEGATVFELRPGRG
jgi:hypothetical protein